MHADVSAGRSVWGAPATSDGTGGGTVLEEDDEILRGVEGKVLDPHTRSSTTSLVSSATLLGSQDATSRCAAPDSSTALANRPPTNSYAWQQPVSATDARRRGRRARQAARRSRSRSRRADVVSTGPPVDPSTSPSAASSIRYWRAGDDVTMAWSCLQT